MITAKIGYSVMSASSDAGDLSFFDVKIEFGDVSEMRNFLHSNDRLFKCVHRLSYSRTSETVVFKAIKIKKIMNTSMIADIQQTTLRDINLEKLLK